MATEMSGEQSCQEIDDTSQNEEPCSEEVKTPSPTILVEDIVSAVRADWRSIALKEGFGVFPPAMLVVSADGQFNQRRRQIVSNLAPVKSWVGHEDDDACKRQRDKAHGHNPV